MATVNQLIETIKENETGQIAGACPGQDSCPIIHEQLRGNARLREENEQLRVVFEQALVAFRKKEEEIEQLEGELRQLLQEEGQWKERLEEAEGKVRLLSKMLFGTSSEKIERAVEQAQVSEESEESSSGIYTINEKGKRGAVEGHKGYGRKIPEGLPVEDVIVELAEEDKCCKQCGKKFIEMSEPEVSYEISVEKRYYVKKIIRKKYMSDCCCSKKFIVAPAVAKLIPKGKFSTEMWVDMLVNKYQMSLPVKRQVMQMKQYGLSVCSGTIFGGFNKIYFSYIEPLYQALQKHLRCGAPWHADETGWYIFLEVEGKDNHNWFMWCYISEDVTLFVLDPSRSSKVPFRVLFDLYDEQIEALKKRPLLQGQEAKILSADRYSAYKVLQECGLIRIAYCWSHVRRDFTDILTKYPLDRDLTLWAQEWIEKIALLYRINNQRKSCKQGEKDFEASHGELKSLLEKIQQQIQQPYEHPVKKQVMESMNEHWKGLTLFLEHPEIPMDNNLSERTLRLAVVGRNNYWGNHSIWGGHLSAAIFSIIQTCTKHNLSPRAYLNYYLTECAKRGSAPPENEIDSFLPHKLKGNPDFQARVPEIVDDT